MADSNPATQASGSNQTTDSPRTDAEEIKKFANTLIGWRGYLSTRGGITPGLNPSYVEELDQKIQEGIDYANRLQMLNYSEAHDVTIRPQFANMPRPIVLVTNTTMGVSSMVDAMLDAHKAAPTGLDLFMDTETNQCRPGLTFFQVCVYSKNTVYLIDMRELGQDAFTTSGTASITLKDILESSVIRKAFFAISGDSHVLWKHYSIFVNGITDLALMAIALVGGSAKQRAKGLPSCIKDNMKGFMGSVERDAWKLRKDWGKKVFGETGEKQQKISSGEEVADGWVAPFNQRPILPEVEEYCVNDVIVMPLVHITLEERMVKVEEKLGKDACETWRIRIAEKTDEYIKKSQSANFKEGVIEGEGGVPEWNGIPYVR